jgi:hypothetical protein
MLLQRLVLISTQTCPVCNVSVARLCFAKPSLQLKGIALNLFCSRVLTKGRSVKADSLFSYQPPINLVALCVMLPASYLLSPMWFHKVPSTCNPFTVL